MNKRVCSFFLRLIAFAAGAVVAADADLLSNAPWIAPFAWPLGLVSAHVGMVIWLAAVLGCLAVCLDVFGAARQHRILAYCFAPVFACLADATIAPFVLLGFSLFVSLYRRRPLLAGASLLLVSIEPHVFFVLAPVFLLDCIVHRNWLIAVGAGGAAGLSILVALCLDPQIGSQYFTLLSARLPTATLVGTLPVLIRMLVPPMTQWMQWLPCVAAAGALSYYWSKRDTWDWASDAAPLLFVAVLTAPFAPVGNQVLLLPAVIVTLASSHRARYAATSFFAINAAALTLLIAQVNSGRWIYLATSTAWFAWYLSSRGSRMEMPAGEYDISLLQT